MQRHFALDRMREPQISITRLQMSRRAALALIAAGLLPPSAWSDDGSEGENADDETCGRQSTLESSFFDFITQTNSLLTKMDKNSPPSWKPLPSPRTLPSPVTNGPSVFDQVRNAYQRRYYTDNDAPENVDLELRMLNETVRPISDEESRAYHMIKAEGKWALSATRGTYLAGKYKCNVAFQEWAMKSGLYPFYDERGIFSRTQDIYEDRDSFICWKPTNEPAVGRIYVYYGAGGTEHHGGVVSDVQRNWEKLGQVGMGISALTHATEDLPAFWNDRGIYKAVLMHAGRPPVKSQIPVVFFEYHCPDMGVRENFKYDE